MNRVERCLPYMTTAYSHAAARTPFGRLGGTLADQRPDEWRGDRGRSPARGIRARILGTLASRLRQTGGRWGVAGNCIGVGQGLAIVLENVCGGAG